MFFKLALLSLFMVISVSYSAPNFNDIRINSGVIGPYEQYEQVNTSVSITYNVSTSFNSRFRVMVGIEENQWFTCFASSLNRINPGDTYNYTYAFPTEYLSSEKDLLISYRVYDEDSAYTPIRRQIDFSIKLSSSKTIYIHDLENKQYKGSPHSLKIIDNEIIYLNDEYDFGYIGEDITEEYYLSIDFRKIKFKYKGVQNSLNYRNAHVKFVDYYNNFPDLEKNRIYTLIPLSIEYDFKEDLYYFKFLNNYYVDKVTHNMSTIKKDKYVATNVLILPKNKESMLEGTSFQFEMYSCGYEQNNFVFSLKYYYGVTILGDCATSNYCIVGENT